MENTLLTWFSKRGNLPILWLEYSPHFLSDPVLIYPGSQVLHLAFSFFTPCLLRYLVPQCCPIPIAKRNYRNHEGWLSDIDSGSSPSRALWIQLSFWPERHTNTMERQNVSTNCGMAVCFESTKTSAINLLLASWLRKLAWSFVWQSFSRVNELTP